MAVYAYIRVSTQMQTFENQKYEIEKYCAQNQLEIEKIYKEAVSGTVELKRRTLNRMLKKMKRGDLLICTELSRLGRNMYMIMSILNVCASKGISIHTIKDRFDLSDTINSKIIAFAFALASEIERNLISQRTKEALEAKKMAGVKLGRPAGESRQRKNFLSHYQDIVFQLDSGVSITRLSKKYGMNRNTLARYLRETGYAPAESINGME
ncbi:MAG: recombinase family protein [Candidatus Cryptobacteroides sp.]